MMRQHALARCRQLTQYSAGSSQARMPIPHRTSTVTSGARPR